VAGSTARFERSRPRETSAASAYHPIPSHVYFDLEDAHPEPPAIEGAMTRREAIIISIAAHIVLGNLLIWLPTMPWFQRFMKAPEIPQQVQVVPPREPMQPFILVEPKIDREALRAIERAPLSDQDRSAQTRERPPNPRNRQPFSRGTTPEFTEAQKQAQRPRGQGPAPQPSPAQQGTNASQSQAPPSQAQPPPSLLPSDQIASRQPPPQPPQPQPSGMPGPTTPAGGALGEALQNLNRYVQNQQFENPSGKGEFGPWIQFDTKGVEFGPWIRRFVAQVKRNWFVPYAAMSLRGHVVLTFNVHKDGRITDLQIVQPSTVDAFNNAAFNALTSSNPTMPLPPEYPSDRAFFTVTFFYNETPPAQ
jgi:TonB family protein